MSVMRVIKNENYTKMSNYHLKDKNLSLKAVGLMSKILGLPDGWEYSVKGLAAICKENKDTVGKIINELMDAGYIYRERSHDNVGQFSGFIYTVYEEPPFARDPPYPKSSDMDSPDTVIPDTDSSAQLITKDINNLNNIPPIVPPGGQAGEKPKKSKGKKKQEPKAAPDWKPDRFAAFWRAYPRGQSKQQAIAAWDKLRPSDELLKVMAKGLKRQMESDEWQRGVGIPYASTWLNNRRWEDEERDIPEAGPMPVAPGREVERWD